MHKNSIKWSRMYIEPWQIVDRTYVSVLASRVLALLNIMLVAMTWHNVQIFMVPWGWTIQSNSSSGAIFMLPLFFSLVIVLTTVWLMALKHTQFYKGYHWVKMPLCTELHANTRQYKATIFATTIKAWRMCMSEKRNLLVMLNTFSAIFALFC